MWPETFGNFAPPLPKSGGWRRFAELEKPAIGGPFYEYQGRDVPRTTHAGPYQPLARAAWPNRNLSELRGKNTLPLTETGLQFFPLRSTYCYG